MATLLLTDAQARALEDVVESALDGAAGCSWSDRFELEEVRDAIRRVRLEDAAERRRRQLDARREFGKAVP